ncbi:hypothetical protein BKA70DRAFT_1406498 [Coprinopsis sp. MPI-PUGE-AT-0042]|nr:hypothetical protein BKA70DRAFT_1406498 [Coprinopsis sp. MPI-PUGE-AT-0042]
MNDLNDELPNEDCSGCHGSKPLSAEGNRPELKNRRTTTPMFQGCEALGFYNCHFTYSGRDYNYSDTSSLSSAAVYGRLLYRVCARHRGIAYPKASAPVADNGSHRIMGA